MTTRLIKFDAFALDFDRYQLCSEGRYLKLEKMPMDLLILLATKKGHLVSRREIVECLWGADVFVDSEHGINTAIRKIRHALRDDPENPRFVETVYGRGYRFIALATEIHGLPATSHDVLADPGAGSFYPPRREPAEEFALRDRSFGPARRPKRDWSAWPWALAGLLVVVAAALPVAANRFGWRPRIVYNRTGFDSISGPHSP